MDNRRGARRVLTFLTIAIVIALAWVAVTTFWLWRHQERVVFQPPVAWAEAPAPAVRVAFTAEDGHELFGYLLAPPAGGAAPTLVIVFHGNADLAAWTVPWARELMERTGATVFVPEYRGYAGIPGAPTYASSGVDARGALAWATSQLRPSSVVLYGHSLGSALASEVALHMQRSGGRPPDALILQSPFTSARDMATRMLVPPIGWLWRRISRVHYDTRAVVAELDAPVFVSHGSRDLNIPARMGIQVFRAARRPGELLVVDRAGHNDVADVGGETYWRWLTSAVRHPTAVRR